MFDQCDTKGRIVRTNRTHHLPLYMKLSFIVNLEREQQAMRYESFLVEAP